MGKKGSSQVSGFSGRTVGNMLQGRRHASIQKNPPAGKSGKGKK